jgi:hypothetical protein
MSFTDRLRAHDTVSNQHSPTSVLCSLLCNSLSRSPPTSPQFATLTAGHPRRTEIACRYAAQGCTSYPASGPYHGLSQG